MNGKQNHEFIKVLLFLVGFLVTVLLLLMTPQSGTANQEQSHKIIAQKNLLAETSDGIVLWHDYGAFALYLVDHDAWLSLPKDIRTQVQLLDNSNQLFVGEKGINVRQHNLRNKELEDAGQGEKLHLIQFVGPIKEEWLAAVEKTGAELVHYIANYGYLVWTDASSRQRLELLAERGNFLQLSIPYLAPFKLGPTLGVEEAVNNGGDDLVEVTIQLYRHDRSGKSERIIKSLFVETLGPWEFVLNYQNIQGVIHRNEIHIVTGLPDVVWVGQLFPRELNDEVQGQIMTNNLIADQTAPAGPGYLSWFIDRGLSTNPNSYPIVDITDDGIGNGIAADAGGDVTLRELGDVTKPSRLAYIENCTSAPNGAGPDGHGHLNISIAGGYDARSGAPFQDSNGYQRGLGINPYGRFAGTRIFDDEGFNTKGCGGTDSGLIRATYNFGARIISNSWGCRICAGVYDVASQAYDAGVRDADPTADGNQELAIVFSSGNYGPDLDTIGTPGNGKNVLTVGASENVRPSWTDGCGISPAQANSVQDIASFSSRGPAPGGRTKPDVVAPGTHIQGTASTAPAYNGSGVCDPYHPANQELFAASSGTSHSAPAVAGLTSLTYGFLQQNYDLTSPSPALLKAFIVANTVYLDGFGSGGDLPSHSQGYGLPNMNAAFDGTPRVVVDQPEAKLFDASGETWSLTVAVADSSKPVRIVMAYTDQPGAVGREPQVNDLNLTVQADGITYLGNRMTRQWSVPGGTPDPVNTVEAVFLPSIDDSSLHIEVTAFNIAGDGVPGVGDNTDQDFTIVCINCIEQSDFTLRAQPTENSICRPGTAEYELNLESVLGFSESVTLDVVDAPAGVNSQFSKNPVTPTDTSQLTLAATETTALGSHVIDVAGEGGDRLHFVSLLLDIYSEEPVSPQLLTPIDGASDLPPTVALSWTETAQAATYNVQIAIDPDFDQIVEEATGLTAASYTTTMLQSGQIYYWRVSAVNSCGDGDYSETNIFSTKPLPDSCPIGGTPEIVYFTNFDTPAGWTHQGTMDSWQLSEERAHSASTSFHAVYPDEIRDQQVSDQRLISPAITLPSTEGELTLQFWNFQSLESNKQEAEKCFDGAILEISTNGGQSWQQIGGPPQDDSILVTDPYDGIVSPEHENPIGGRSAWCGEPQDWLNSVVRIDEFAGRTVRFRFRLGTDLSIGADLGHEGWYVDDVRVQFCPRFTNSSFLPAVFSFLE